MVYSLFLLLGPMLSSGMCSEVFQFDVHQLYEQFFLLPQSLISQQSNSRMLLTTVKGKAGGFFTVFQFLLHDLSITGEHVGSFQKDSFQGNKSASPMVVSVLVDPREAGDIEVDGMITPKQISRIFVVVLIDSVKYVTYSCVLPRTGLHLVTT